jgi:hypothetical protein
MKHQNISNGGNAPKVVDHHVVALYMAETGTIRHLHTVTVFEGGHPVDEPEAVGRAQAKATQAGHNTVHLKIKVSKNADHGRRPHRIDLKTGEFVSLEIKPPDTNRSRHSD